VESKKQLNHLVCRYLIW